MPMELVSSDWFSVNIPHWEHLLQEFRGRPDIHGLEIGSYEGRSACWLLQNIFSHPTSTLTCVDVFEKRPEMEEIIETMQIPVSPDVPFEDHFDRNIRTIGAEKRVIKKKGESRVVLRALPFAHYDFVYIDGSHTTSDVLRDAVLCWDLLKDGGILIFDDYDWVCFPHEPLKNPGIGVDAFLQCFEGEYELVHKTRQIAVRKISSPRLP